MFEAGLQYIRADFHLHTCKDKEFIYSGEQSSFVNDYVSALKEANINVGVITNHNKFDRDEYKAIRKAAKKQDIFILPGVELTIKEGAMVFILSSCLIPMNGLRIATIIFKHF